MAQPEAFLAAIVIVAILFVKEWMIRPRYVDVVVSWNFGLLVEAKLQAK